MAFSKSTRVFRALLIIVVTILLLSSCSSIGNKAGDYFVRSLMKTYVGDNYAKVASMTTYTNEAIDILEIGSPPKVKVIGNELYNKQLESGNSIHVHLLPQKKSESGGFSLLDGDLINIGNKTQQRFDVLAFLVDKKGIIIDYGHGRYNTESSCTSIIFVGKLDGCDKQVISDISSEVQGLITTSSGEDLSAWK